MREGGRGKEREGKRKRESKEKAETQKLAVPGTSQGSRLGTLMMSFYSHPVFKIFIKWDSVFT